MKWLEVIHLRSPEAVQEDLIHLMGDLLTGVHRPEGLVGLNFYSHSHLKGDFCLQLLWESDHFQLPRSALGLKLSQVFKEFGLTRYNLWKEEE